jgi:hypothetical protein
MGKRVSHNMVVGHADVGHAVAWHVVAVTCSLLRYYKCLNSIERNTVRICWSAYVRFCNKEHVLLSGGACTGKASEWRRFSEAPPMEKLSDLRRLPFGPSACESSWTGTVMRIQRQHFVISTEFQE